MSLDCILNKHFIYLLHCIFLIAYFLFVLHRFAVYLKDTLLSFKLYLFPLINEEVIAVLSDGLKGLFLKHIHLNNLLQNLI